MATDIDAVVTGINMIILPSSKNDNNNENNSSKYTQHDESLVSSSGSMELTVVGMVDVVGDSR